ncbi:MAG: CHAT domain-containing protein, partial [Cyanobacteria bacterium J06555_13]
SHQWKEAQLLTEAALTTAQTINAADIAYQWQWQLGRLLKQQNKPEEALQAYRAAFNSLQSIHQDLSATHQGLQFSFRDSVEPIYRELVDLLLQPAQNARHQEARHQEARTVIEALQVAELDNFFRTACLDAQKVALEDVEETDAAVVYPIILSDRIEIIVSLPGQPLQQFTTPVLQAELAQTIADWRLMLEKPFTAPEGKVLGQTLYQWLIAPMQPALADAQVTTLAFVLDGVLRNVPMAALHTGEHYLVEDYEIALSPGLQLLGPRALQDIGSKVLLAGLTQPRHGFSGLSHVATELRTVQSLADSHLLLDEDFTAQRLAQQINRANQPIVHLATHGKFSSNLDETFILAWDRRIPVVEMSDLLKTGDLNRQDPIELLMLSACETAAGDNRAALGLAGIALQSGTRSTLASLWSVDDASSALFVEQFYQQLNQPDTSKANALRQAQLALLQNADYRHPRYWSAYVLIGNWL